MTCAPSEDSDQPGHPPRLIRVFAVRMKKAWILSYPLSAQRRLRSDWADAQADLSLRWAHSHFVGFVMRRLILYPCHSVLHRIWDQHLALAIKHDTWTLHGAIWYQRTVMICQVVLDEAGWLSHTDKADGNRSIDKSIVHTSSIFNNLSEDIWAATWQNQQSDCAPGEDSDQPGHPSRLIRVFAVRLMGS